MRASSRKEPPADSAAKSNCRLQPVYEWCGPAWPNEKEVFVWTCQQEILEIFDVVYYWLCSYQCIHHFPGSFREDFPKEEIHTVGLCYGTWWISHWKLLWTKETVHQRNSISLGCEWQPDATRSCEDGRPAPSLQTLLCQRCKERSCERMCRVQYSHVFPMFSWETLNKLDFPMMQNSPVIQTHLWFKTHL